MEDNGSGATIDVQVKDVSDVVAQSADGYYVYPHAHASGGTVLHRTLIEGAEDFVSFETRPAVPEVDYQVSLGDEVSGLRLVGNTLEMVDQEGTPRLRAEPPYVVGADGARTDAALAVEGCAVDTDASAPWGRDAVDPGARSCTVKVRWPDESVVYPAVLDPRWTTTGSMTTPRQGHTATLLSTGKVLVAGGTSNGTTALASAELYDRTTGTWAATGSMTGARTLHTATQLNTGSNGTTSGMVLVAGGLNGTTSQSTAQLYSPSAGTWTAAATLNAARHGHTATLLASGNVLLAGGLNGTTVLNTAAIYNPSSGTGTWTATGTMPQAVKLHTATRLNVSSNGTLNNKVLVVGGNSGTASVANVQLFDGTSTWSSLTALSSAREGHTATALANGNVLITGGKSGSTVLNTTQLFNAASGSGSWASAGTMTTARQLHAALLLPSALVENGQVLLAGGNNGSSTLSSAELWNGTSTWTATSTLPAAVQSETVTLLSNNMVLIAGGVNGSTTVATADLYDASFSLACTSNSQCATGFCVSGVCCDTACNGGCGVCNLAGHVGTCSAASSGTVCRAQNGACDVAETCNGTSLTCPSDGVAALGTVCRPKADFCDVAETCDGSTKACPTDGFAPPTTVCHASTGTCDATVTCTGSSASCPPDTFAPAGTVCRPSTGGCDVAETCTGSSSLCPADSVAAAGTVCRPAESICDLAESCDGSSSACPSDAFAAAGTACGAATGNSSAPVCSGSAGTCPVASGTSDVLGFENAADWTLDPGDNGTTAIVGTNSNRTQGATSLEVTAQNYARFNSAPVSSIGSVGPLVLMDVLLPTDQANQFWYGDAQMFVNSATLGLFNVFLSDVPLTGLALGTWQTLAFQMPATAASAIASGVYADLTFSVVLNVPYNENGHYLIDNIQSIPDVVPSLLGIAQDGSTLKAIFDYQTTSSTPVNIPYGTANGLTNQNGFIASPPEVPPTTFVSTTHAPFVATLSGSLLTWTIGSHSVTATPSSQQLPVTTNPDGTHDAGLPGGGQVNIDSVPPQSPNAAGDPTFSFPFNGMVGGQFSVTPTGAATYTVPITIPPGVAGVSPQLSLVYNSQGADGIAGQGWSLSGLSTIYRCPKTRPDDGQAHPVNLTDDPSNPDGFCLDGQRMFETASGSGIYNLEKKDFSTIQRMSDGHFQVTTKAGETRAYGSTLASRIQQFPPNTTGSGANPNAPVDTVWFIDTVTDPWSNYYTVEYNNDGVNWLTVSAIHYTGHSGSPVVSPPNTITFSYVTRPEVRWLPMGQLKYPLTQRLTSITTPLGTYTLTYQNNTTFVGADPALPSLLQSIGYTAGNTPEQTLVFGWQKGSHAWQPAPSGYLLPTAITDDGAGLAGTQFIDLDGDGRLDLVLARDKSSVFGTWHNGAHGWEQLGSAANLPLRLSDSNGNPTGVRFADFDGDGLPDVAVDFANVACNGNVCDSCPINQGCSGAKGYSPAVWLNRIGQGGGWEFHPEYGTLPTNSGFQDGQLSFTQPVDHAVVTDINNDGLADIVRVTENSGMGGTGADMEILLNQGHCPSGNTQSASCGQPSWLRGHIFPEAFPVFSTGEGDEFGYPPFTLEDVNRDGLPDIVSREYFINSDGNTLETSEVDYLQLGPTPDGSSCSREQPGNQLPLGAICFSTSPIQNFAVGGTAVEQLVHPAQLGDIDGDGFYDSAAYYSTYLVNGNNNPGAFQAGVGFGNQNLSFAGSLNLTYSSVFGKYSPVLDTTGAPDVNGIPPDFGFALIDINGDGLVDLIRNHANRTFGEFTGKGGGQILYNNGTTWIDRNGLSTWQVPAGTDAIPGAIPSDATTLYGSAFVDLDGDGLPDLVQMQAAPSNGFPSPAGAWLNQFTPPRITSFPNNLGKPTSVVYKSIAQDDSNGTATVDLYSNIDDAVSFEPGTKRGVFPLQVVASATMEDGSGTHTTTTQAYHYFAMRVSPDGRGPQGFRQVQMSDSATNTLTVTTYSQAYPYTGLATEIVRYQLAPFQALQVSDTTTQYCDSNAVDGQGNPICSGPGQYTPGTSIFIHPTSTKDFLNLNPEDPSFAKTITTTSTFQFDDNGNSMHVEVKAVKTENGVSETQDTKTDNLYQGDAETTQGEVTQTTVTNTNDQGTKPPHTTTFAYVPVSTFGGSSTTALALSLKRLEPAAGWPLELDTAYGYDSFGNLTTTTNCANDFGQCSPGAPGPVGTTDPAHVPFRTTTVSFNPADFNGPTGTGLTTSLSYAPGRFPVKISQKLPGAPDHTEFTAYDPVKGVLLQRTGGNGINTCYRYDDLGRQTSETERCGSSAPLTTTTNYFYSGAPLTNFEGQLFEVAPNTGSPPTSATVIVTRAADGTTSWVYGDYQGKGVGVASHSFDGGFTENVTTYNALGLVLSKSKPFHLANFTDTPSPAFVTNHYDTVLLSRVDSITEDLGVIDTSNKPKTGLVTMTYDGSSLVTTRTVNGNSETRTEFKDVAGRVEKIIDAAGTLTNVYDADGSLVSTTDNAGNVVSSIYDSRGRKTSSTDPDLGTWSYGFNGFGDLIQKIDPNAVRINPATTGTTMTYDTLGRITSKTDATGTAQWVYDVAPGAGVGKIAAMIGAPDPKLAGPCSVPFVTATDGNRAGKSYAYTQFGDLQSTSECTDGTTFTTTHEYDGLGRQSLVRYPAVGNSQLAVGYHYTSLGFLQYLTDESTDYSVLWQAKTVNELGQVTDEQLRNGVETVANRNSSTGWLMGSVSTAHSDGNSTIQNWGYSYDEFGNLLSRTRKDTVNDATSSESFTYDLLNRIMTSTVTVGGGSPTTDNYAYDTAGLGNIQQKSQKTYNYNTGCMAGERPAGPHAVCSLSDGTTFAYDDDGNMTGSSAGRTITYDPQNRVSHIDSHPATSQGNDTGTVDFSYGADGHRVVQAATNGGQTSRTVYVGLDATGRSLYERTTTGSTVQHVNYIYAGTAHNGAPFALRVLASDGSVSENRYYSVDHLGSVTAMSDDVGHVVNSPSDPADAQVFGYDPWGARRNPDGNAAAPASFNLQVGHREFTGQETIPSVGLLNLNGRVYDPVLGRFLSPDPHVQNPADLQSYNRYSYVLNNPLRYTDPTGYWSFLGLSGTTWADIGIGLVGIAVCAGTSGAGCSIAFALATMALNTTVAIASGAGFDQVFESVLVGAVSGVLGGALGAGLGNVIGNAIGGTAGAWIGSVVGGAASGALSALFASPFNGFSNLGRNMLVGAVIGAGMSAANLGFQQAAGLTQASAGAGVPGAGSGESDAELQARAAAAAGEAARVAGEAASSSGGTDQAGVPGGGEDQEDATPPDEAPNKEANDAPMAKVPGSGDGGGLVQAQLSTPNGPAFGCTTAGTNCGVGVNGVSGTVGPDGINTGTTTKSWDDILGKFTPKGSPPNTEIDDFGGDGGGCCFPEPRPPTGMPNTQLTMPEFTLPPGSTFQPPPLTLGLDLTLTAPTWTGRLGLISLGLGY